MSAVQHPIPDRRLNGARSGGVQAPGRTVASMTLSRSKSLVGGAIVLGVVLLAVAVVYLALPAHELPSFFPGQASPTDAEAGHHHIKHAVAAFAVGLACLCYAWLATGPQHRSGDDRPVGA